jgi:non-ribosomal peptide synthetase component F
LPLITEPSANWARERATLVIEVSEEVEATLKKVSKGDAVAIFTLLMSSVMVMVYRYTGVEGGIIGTMPPRSVANELIFCQNRIQGDLTVKEWIGQTKEQILEAFNYGAYDFNEFYEMWHHKYVGERPNIFTVALTYERLQNSVPAPRRFGLVLTLSERDQNMVLQAQYDRSTYADEMVNGFCRRVLELFNSFSDKLTQRISELEILQPM